MKNPEDSEIVGDNLPQESPQCPAYEEKNRFILSLAERLAAASAVLSHLAEKKEQRRCP